MDIQNIDPYTPPERPGEKPAANVFELLDRILDKGLVIVGDIRVSVADIELLKLQIRLLIASVETAKKMGIDFSWAKAVEGTRSNELLQEQIHKLEHKLKMQQEESLEQGSQESDVSKKDVAGLDVPESEMSRSVTSESENSSIPPTNTSKQNLSDSDLSPSKEK